MPASMKAVWGRTILEPIYHNCSCAIGIVVAIEEEVRVEVGVVLLNLFRWHVYVRQYLSCVREHIRFVAIVAIGWAM